MSHKKFEFVCKNPECKHKFKESLRDKTTESILVCPKCEFSFPIKDIDVRNISNLIALLQESERCRSKIEK